MKITCDKNLLLSNINIVLKAVANKSSQQILECILINANENSIKLTAFDGEMGITTDDIDAQVFIEGSIAINAKMFTDIVRHLPEGDVSISVGKNNSTKIVCGNSDYKITGLSGEEFPALPKVDKNGSIVLKQNELKKMINQTIFAVSVEEARVVLTGESFEIYNGQLTIAAVDGFRIAVVTTEIENKEENVKLILPGKTLGELIKLLEGNNDVFIYYTDKHMMLDLGFATVVTRLIDGDFFKYEHLFGNDYETLLTVNRTQFLSCIERVVLISPSNKKVPVNIKIETDHIVVSMENEVGSAVDEMSAVVEGSTLDITFNPKYLADVLKVIDEDEITIQFTTSLSPCILKPIDSKNYKCLILPIKIK